jgi:hypothetical protein
MLAPVALWGFCIALNLSRPNQTRLSREDAAHRDTFFLEQESHALRLDLPGGFDLPGRVARIIYVARTEPAGRSK